ncbi:MAG: hypothetical protein AB1791_13675 [Chloroflexota bacterium]
MLRQDTFHNRAGPFMPNFIHRRPDEAAFGSAGGLLARLVRVVPRQFIIGAILVVALFGFEIFNFDTTRYALRNLLGEVSFGGVGWATILAMAFCAIDFAGLARFFAPERGQTSQERWYLMGAWLLGATMNALMTWWAVSLALLEHNFGNEILSRQQLLQFAPVFVAVLVWLTRILFIGAFTVAGDHLFVAAEIHTRPGVAQRQPVVAPIGPAESVEPPPPPAEPVAPEEPAAPVTLRPRRPAQSLFEPAAPAPPATPLPARLRRRPPQVGA